MPTATDTLAQGPDATVELDDAELGRRRAAWQPRPPVYASGVFAKYAALVASPAEGAITRPPR